MQLANPWALLALISLPTILILYSLRPKRRTVLLSSTALWREALRERQRGLGLQKLLRNLSLLALLLFALVISIGLANPGWVVRSSLSGDAVLIIDVSASMKARDGASTRFARAKAEAEDLIDELPDGARLLIIASGRDARLLSAFETNRPALRHALDGLVATDEVGQPRAALTLALSLLRSREQGRVIFLTDAAFDQPLSAVGPSVEYRVIGTSGSNVAITRFDLRREIGSQDRFELLLTVKNYNRATVTAPVTVWLDEKPILERTLQLPAGGKETVVVPYISRSGGLGGGLGGGRARASLDYDDDLAADNHAYAVLGVDERLRIALYTAGNFYLESALEALPNALVNKRDVIRADQLRQDADTHDLVVLDRVVAPELSPGNYLLIDSVPPGLPFMEEGPEVVQPRVEGTGTSALMRQLDLSGVRIDAARRVVSRGNAPGLQRLFWSAETALGLAFIEDQIRVVYLGFDIAQSNLPLQTAFPLFIQRSVGWLRGAESRLSNTQVAAGDRYSIRVPTGQNRLILRTPAGDGVVYEVAGGQLDFDATSQSGIYRYTQSDAFGEGYRYFAVNLADEAESNIEPRAAMPTQVSAPRERDSLARATLALWPYLALVALVILALESCLGFRWQRSA